jgi:hypothetical protein
MRRFDKTKNMLNANLLAEQRYLASKGLIKEVTDNYDNTANRAGESGINQFGDKDYEERQKLMNMPNDNIIYNIEQNGKYITFSFDSNDTGTAKVEVYGDNEEIVATYYFKLADLANLDDRPWVGLADASLGDNANISAQAEDYITDMIEKGDELVQKHNEYVNSEYNDNHPDEPNPYYDRHERLDEEDYDTLRDLKAAGVNPNNKGDVEEYLGRELTDDEYNEMLGRRNKEYNKPTYKLDLTTKEGSPYTPIEIKARTSKAALVKLKHNESGREKELWIPNFVIKNNVISTSFIDKNF